ncbi:hypothetical protein ABMA27_013608 [Loxostege sticticalis]|uniref:Uncharacterized protein n=1 Tax=Loxostege sticticalis TaxID=481309 RepID=A0ABR3IFW0_LOXSC
MFKSLLLVVVVCSVVAVWSAPKEVRWHDLNNVNQIFEEFERTYQKQYQNEDERQARLEIFKENLKMINQRNAESKTATFGINRFTDMTTEEALQRFTCLRGIVDDNTCPSATEMVRDVVPDSFDWRDKKKVTRVKDQGNCGSCWAFSAVGNLEGQYAIKHNKLRELSEQQIVDCDENDYGCGGGWMASAFVWLQKHGGIESEEDYPYVAPKDQSCKFDKSKAVATVSGCKMFNGKDENALKQVLVSNGPLSIAIDATGIMGYFGGIVEDCPAGGLNHGVLLVGYGIENTTEYWIIKNSWSADWGEQGYFRVKMHENSCNMTAYITSSVVN